MSSTSLYFSSRDLTEKFFQSYFDRLDNTYTGFARSTGYSIRLFTCYENSKQCYKWVFTNAFRRRGISLSSLEPHTPMQCIKVFRIFWESCHIWLERYYNFWNEVPYMRVAQGTYSTESETLPLPLRVHTRSSLTVCSCVRTHLRCRYAWVALSRSFLRCRYAVVSLSRSYLRWTNIPEARWQCVRHKREAYYTLLVYSHILALTYDTGSNFNDPCLRLIDFNFLHFAKFWISFRTFHIFLLLASHKVWIAKNELFLRFQYQWVRKENDSVSAPPPFSLPLFLSLYLSFFAFNQLLCNI